MTEESAQSYSASASRNSENNDTPLPMPTLMLTEEHFNGRYGAFFQRLYQRLQLTIPERTRLENLLNGTGEWPDDKEEPVASMFQHHEAYKRQIMTQISRNYQAYNERFGFTNEIYEGNNKEEELAANGASAPTWPAPARPYSPPVAWSKQPRNSSIELSRRTNLIEMINCVHAKKLDNARRLHHIRELTKKFLPENLRTKAIHDMYSLTCEIGHRIQEIISKCSDENNNFTMPRINDLRLGFFCVRM
eukprot:gb/GECG01008713.1/.p1 GENE.gb/GECG01008713.1/~~gb/GECG01008713.1/.p1  ORF type:complete len:248 (+),score=22.05 gb/GECG01008713.1/:1-744(+)